MAGNEITLDIPGKSGSIAGPGVILQFRNEKIVLTSSASMVETQEDLQRNLKNILNVLSFTEKILKAFIFMALDIKSMKQLHRCKLWLKVI